jgi:hypothetical protein
MPIGPHPSSGGERIILLIFLKTPGLNPANVTIWFERWTTSAFTFVTMKYKTDGHYLNGIKAIASDIIIRAGHKTRPFVVVQIQKLMG